jgi:predicted nucleic acid-binding protein
VFRREVLLPSGSVFDFWKYCTGSKERGYEIWIWTSANLLNEENQVAQRASSVCVDISALLSLTDLGLLDALRRAFTTIVIPHEIDNLLLQQRHGIDAPHPLATALSNWIQQNRGLVRLRTRMGGEEEEAPVVGPFLIGDAGIYVPHRPPMSDVLRGGTGDAMLLAKELQIPLYSDDTAVRQMARTECGVQGFSTISLVARLQAEGKLSVEQEAEILARMLSKHFRAVPIAPEHLTARLRVLYDAARANGRALRIDDMRRDNVLGTLLPELWDTVLTLQARAMLTTGWWLDVARDDSFPQDVLDETIPVPSFAIAQEAKGGVILGISEKGPEKVAALLWTAFLWRAWRSEEALLGRAWSAVKTAARRRSRGQHDYERYIWDWVPKMLTRIIEQCQDLTDLQKASNWVKLDMALPAEDRTHFERVHATQQPSFKR